MAAALVLAVGAMLTMPLAATAEAPPLFGHIPFEGNSGSGAGQLDYPRGVAIDQATGHVYVADREDMRINEFDAWGIFVKAFGWGVRDGNAEPETCTTETGCLKGLAGFGAGQFSLPEVVAVDSTGNIYVGEQEGYRVQKFNSAGEFLLMFGGEVDKTTKANVCTKASGDQCGVGIAGTGNGQFGATFGPLAKYTIAVGPVDTVFVGDKDRIEEFNPDGTYKSQLALPQSGIPKALAVDPNTGDIYVAIAQEFGFEPEFPYIWKHTGVGWDDEFAEVGDKATATFPMRGWPEALATDSAGNLYVFAREQQTNRQPWEEILEFDSTGKKLIPSKNEEEECEEAEKKEKLCTFFGKPTDGTVLNGMATSSACNVPSDTLYVAQSGGEKDYVSAFGSSPDPSECPAPLFAPEIKQQYAVSVDDGGATVRAAINPRFWPDTRYYVEYGTEECNKGGCQAQPVPPGAVLSGGAVSFPVNTAGVFLTDLQPDTTYHYRFVAQSSGGGPVYGVDPDGAGAEEPSFEKGLESTFTTFPVPGEPLTCPGNQQFRIGVAAHLPDCRAYEMVSPVDKENGDVAVLSNVDNEPSRTDQGSVDGGRFTYSSYRAFGEPESAPYTSQYLASRGEGGWSSEGISPPREGSQIPNERRGLDVQFKAFSDDLCTGWLLQDSEPILDPAAPPGFADLYRRENCGGVGYEALNMAVPTSKPAGFLPELQGLSADGTHAVFRARGALTPGANPDPEKYQLYEASPGGLRLVSVLPNGTARTEHNTAGSVGRNANHDHSVWRAMSADGSRVYWSAMNAAVTALGPIYVRENADQEQSAISGGKCSEPEKACTYQVSSAAGRFWGATPDGSLALYTVGGELFKYSFKNKKSTLIAKGVEGLLGYGEDLSGIYLASTEVLSGVPNSDGDKALAGKPNLYLYEGGAFTFVATLSDGDLPTKGAASPISEQPGRHTGRVSPNGSVAAFTSTAPLSGYDNTDIGSEEADAEVYLYDATANGGAGKLLCVSCDRSGARPVGRNIAGLGTFPSTTFWAAANVPAWPTQLHSSHTLSDDGSRLFFESYGPLVLRDTNGKRDVYEWERRASKEDCEKAGAELFVAKAGGCISLISSGESGEDSEFLDAGPSASDVFFATEASLLPQDYGLIDIYDARVGGGFPAPPPPQPPCEGEACQSPPAPPNDPTPSSANLSGFGNAKVHNPKHRCAKGKTRRKGRCVAKKHKRAKRRAGQARRAGR